MGRRGSVGVCVLTVVRAAATPISKVAHPIAHARIPQAPLANLQIAFPPLFPRSAGAQLPLCRSPGGLAPNDQRQPSWRQYGPGCLIVGMFVYPSPKPIILSGVRGAKNLSDPKLVVARPLKEPLLIKALFYRHIKEPHHHLIRRLLSPPYCRTRIWIMGIPA